MDLLGSIYIRIYIEVEGNKRSFKKIVFDYYNRYGKVSIRIVLWKVS